MFTWICTTGWMIYIGLFWLCQLHPWTRRLVQYGIRQQLHEKTVSWKWAQRFASHSLRVSRGLSICQSTYWRSLYAMALAWHLSVVMVAMFVTRAQHSSTVGVAIILLYALHLTRRLFECLFLLQFSNRTRVSWLQAIAGYGFYVQVSLTIILHGSYSTACPHGSWWTWWIGAGLFLLGNIGQYVSHRTLASLRGTTGQQGNTISSRYAIPLGHLFTWISCPHYLCEIIIYIGLCIMVSTSWTWACAAPAVLLTLFVASNLSRSALDTHRWYLEHFGDLYRAKNRKALVPWLL